MVNKITLVDITPDVRLLRVLRNSGFNNLTAMGELLDNAVDAGASKIDIYVQVQPNGKIMLMIVDNGKGMSDNTLKYALTLAKELKVGIDQLGRYGMGLKTASLSMTTQLEIFSKTSHSEIVYGEFNMNKMENLGSFKTTVREATEEEREFFNNKVSKTRSGTIILLKNCDRIGVKAETLINQLKDYIGRTYRVFINRGVTFTISNTYKEGEKIEAIDPLMRNHKDTILVRDRETFPIEYTSSNGNVKTTFIEVSAVILPKAEKHGKLVNGVHIPITINQANQGLYFLREGREVSTAITWVNVFGERHPSLNRFRIEIVVKSELDDEIKMDFQKGNVHPTSKFKEQLSKIIKNGVLKEMKEILEEQERTVAPKNKEIVEEEAKPKQESVHLIEKGASNELSHLNVPFKKEKTEFTSNLEKDNGKLTGEVIVTTKVENPLQQYKEILQAAEKVNDALKSNNTPKEIKDTIIKLLQSYINEIKTV